MRTEELAEPPPPISANRKRYHAHQFGTCRGSYRSRTQEGNQPQNADVHRRGRFGRSLESFSAHGRVGSIDIAIKKAKTACFFGMATGKLGQLSQPGKPLYGIEQSNDGLITFPGGLPIVDEDGVLVGAIGVSGSVVENDHAVAEAGVNVLGVSELPEHPWRT